MARGWESKTVEAQIETAEGEQRDYKRIPLNASEAEILRAREGLLLTRTRVLQDLERARHERYRQMLREALSQLERDLVCLGPQP